MKFDARRVQNEKVVSLSLSGQLTENGVWRGKGRPLWDGIRWQFQLVEATSLQPTEPRPLSSPGSS